MIDKKMCYSEFINDLKHDGCVNIEKRHLKGVNDVLFVANILLINKTVNSIEYWINPQSSELFIIHKPNFLFRILMILLFPLVFVLLKMLHEPCLLRDYSYSIGVDNCKVSSIELYNEQDLNRIYKNASLVEYMI